MRTPWWKWPDEARTRLARLRGQQTFWISLLALVAPFGWALPAHAGGIAADLEGQVQADPNSDERVSVIVQYGTKTAGEADSDRLAQRHGGVLIRHHDLIHGATLLVPKRMIHSLQHHP